MANLHILMFFRSKLLVFNIHKTKFSQYICMPFFLISIYNFSPQSFMNKYKTIYKRFYVILSFPPEAKLRITPRTATKYQLQPTLHSVVCCCGSHRPSLPGLTCLLSRCVLASNSDGLGRLSTDFSTHSGPLRTKLQGCH